jgi:hypothetical protein
VTPVASRNVANILIFVGLLPVLLWLFLLAKSLLHSEDFLPRVSAGIIMFGVPLGMRGFWTATRGIAALKQAATPKLGSAAQERVRVRESGPLIIARRVERVSSPTISIHGAAGGSRPAS